MCCVQAPTILHYQGHPSARLLVPACSKNGVTAALLVARKKDAGDLLLVLVMMKAARWWWWWCSFVFVFGFGVVKAWWWVWRWCGRGAALGCGCVCVCGGGVRCEYGWVGGSKGSGSGPNKSDGPGGRQLTCAAATRC